MIQVSSQTIQTENGSQNIDFHATESRHRVGAVDSEKVQK